MHVSVCIHKRHEQSCMFHFKGAGVRQIHLSTAKMPQGGVMQNTTIF